MATTDHARQRDRHKCRSQDCAPISVARSRGRVAAFLVAIATAFGGMACSDNLSPSASERQQELLRDPFGYKMDDTNDISGGNINHLDRDALKKDIGNVLNP